MAKPKEKIEIKIPELSAIPEIADLINHQIQEWHARDAKSRRQDKDIDYSLITVDSLNRKRPAVQWYFKDWLASSAFRLMNESEFNAYIKFLLESGNEHYQSFLPWNVKDLRSIIKATETKFIRIWQNRLYLKFKFAKHEGHIYIYNPRMFKEIMKMHENALNGSKGALIREANRDSREETHSFNESPYYDKELFKKELKSDARYMDVDADYYYEIVLNWSKSSKKKRADWLSVAKSIILNHADENKLKLVAKIVNGKGLKIRFPDYWSAELEKKFSVIELQQYWSHLRGLGLKPKKHPVSNTIIDWVKA